MAFAGICRTDLYAAEGRFPNMPARVVLGHEGAGVVARSSPHIAELNVGDPVTILPRVACRACSDPLSCDHERAAKLGVDRDGVFADYVALPASSVRRVPASMSLKLAAYVEPVAAALAVKPCLPRGASAVLIYGKNRIAELTRRIINVVEPSIETIVVASHDETVALRSGSMDVAIETTTTNETMRALTHVVRRGGSILLKSRPVEPIALDVGAAVEKELTLRAVRYGSFDEAIDLLASGRLDVTDLLGETFPLERWEDAFAAARRETVKPFFELLL